MKGCAMGMNGEGTPSRRNDPFNPSSVSKMIIFYCIRLASKRFT